MGAFCFVSAWTKRRAEEIGGWRFPNAQIIPPGLSPNEFPPLVQPPERLWRWRLLWVGRVIRDKGIETAIHALSFLPRNAMLEIVGMVDPAYRQHLEALASGCPVIATGVGGSSEYCRDGVNCLRVPLGDPEALARAAQQLAQSGGLRRCLVEGGLRTAGAFTLDRQGAGIERLLLAASSAPRV
jgi:glycosyltransferase involved in cell wall biosynthesis